MSEKNRPRSAEELLPPQSSARDRQPAARDENRRAPWDTSVWMPSSLMRRVLNKVVEKEFKSYGARVSEVNNVIALWTERLRLEEEYEKRLSRFEALPLLTNAAKAQAYAEAEQIFADASRVSEEIEDKKRERYLNRIRTEADIIRAERELEDLKRGPAPPALPPPPPPPKESRANQKAAAIKRIREECDRLIAVLLAGRKEEELDEDDRQLVDECRLSAMRQIKAILQEDD